ncbi:PREDICTED: uncharacterized protein LOC105599020 isoform X7 [Cercocebus atys]|uniref:uncharacterized protein LOC105599020 isoform X7 n=1 Tax=Cercocebus atys TaxID=9531 RepID=UPI0005F4CE1A|nr:PREDICTED: uncharacterized protein LOC105599020 isoform X7 [Cercocebus atys]
MRKVHWLQTGFISCVNSGKRKREEEASRSKPEEVDAAPIAQSFGAWPSLYLAETPNPNPTHLGMQKSLRRCTLTRGRVTGVQGCHRIHGPVSGQQLFCCPDCTCRNADSEQVLGAPGKEKVAACNQEKNLPLPELAVISQWGGGGDLQVLFGQVNSGSQTRRPASVLMP